MTSDTSGNGMCAPKVEEDAVHRIMHGSLPQVLSCILGHLSVADVCRVCTVCKEWNKLANGHQLWKGLCDRDEVIQKQLTLNQIDLRHGCYYKCVYRKYATVMKRWMSGEGVTTFTKTLLTPTGVDSHWRGDCKVVSSSYILVTSEQHTDNNMYPMYVYSGVTGEYLHVLCGLIGHPVTVLLSNAESMVAASSRQSSVVCVWKVQTAECLHSLDHPHNVQLIAMHNTMLAVGFSGGVFVWNVQNGQWLHKLSGPELVSSDELVMDSDHLAVHSYNGGRLQLWNITTGALLLTLTHPHRTSQLLLDAGTHSVICDGLNNTWHVWDTETGACRTIIYADHEYDVNVDAARQEETVVVYSADDNAVQSDDFQSALVQDGKLIIASVSRTNDGVYCPSILVMHLKSSSILCRINCPIELESVDDWNGWLTAVSTLPRFVMMYSYVRRGADIADSCLYLYDVQKGGFVRGVNEGQGMDFVIPINASFKTLQLVISFDVMNNCLFEQAETLLSEAKAGCVAAGSEAHGQLVQDWLNMHKYRGTHKHMHISSLPSTTQKPPANSNKIPLPRASTRFKLVSKKSVREKPVKGPVKTKAKTIPLAPVKLDAVVNGDTVLACSQCEKRYTDASLLEQHVKTKHTVSDHQCHICNKCFATTTTLKVHMATVHEGVKRHQCPTCGKAFGLLFNLVNHIKSIHEGQKFACDECGKQFTEKRALKKHARIHSGAKPYVCDICAKRFTQVCALSRHRNTVHLHIKAHQCPLCEKWFGEASNMKKHMRQVHSM